MQQFNNLVHYQSFGRALVIGVQLDFWIQNVVKPNQDIEKNIGWPYTFRISGSIRIVYGRAVQKLKDFQKFCIFLTLTYYFCKGQQHVGITLYLNLYSGWYHNEPVCIVLFYYVS